ncbi:hypothetical protein [Altericista sp. CCNU0014]
MLSRTFERSRRFQELKQRTLRFLSEGAEPIGLALNWEDIDREDL